MAVREILCISVKNMTKSTDALFWMQTELWRQKYFKTIGQYLLLIYETRNIILSVLYIIKLGIRGKVIAETYGGSAFNYLCKLNIFYTGQWQYK